MSSLTHDLARFHGAQNSGAPTAFERAVAELQAGRKCSHWIWFVLPQLRGLGRSAMAQRYGIANLEEARTYLADPLLSHRLNLVIALIRRQLSCPGQSLTNLMAGEVDAAKMVSSLTLFEAAGLSTAGDLLDQIGRRCSLTLSILDGATSAERGNSAGLV